MRPRTQAPGRGLSERAVLRSYAPGATREPRDGAFVSPHVDRRTSIGVALTAGGLLAVGFVWVMLVGSYDQYAAALIAGALIMVSVPLARHAARLEQWPALSGLMMAAMVLRLAGSLARYGVAYGAYGGVADASTYNQVALGQYHNFRHFHIFTPDTGVFDGLVPWLNTVIYALCGPTEIGAFFVFAWFNFLGSYFFYRAFRIGYPNGDGRRYAVVLFFLPSLLYWPSSLGKESWMVLSIGVASYGLARALASRPGGYLASALGIAGMLMVRPHLALIFLPAAFFAFLFRRSRPGRKYSGWSRIIGLALLVVGSFVVIGKAQSYFGISNLDVQTVTQQLNTTRQQTDLGNSAFNPPNPKSPLGFPEAIATVLFRPFPFEAHSLTVLVSSLEGMILILLFVLSAKRLRRIGKAVRESRYLLFAIVYSVLFIFAFANFSNFGILARERVQMFPLLLVLLAIPAGEPVGPSPGEDVASVEGRPQKPRLPSYRDRVKTPVL